MNFDYTMSKEQADILSSLIGKRIIATLSILDSGDSAGEYVLVFEDEEIVINAKEESSDVPWLDDTRVVEIVRRPSGSADGNLLFPKQIDDTIIGISRIVTTMTHKNADKVHPDTAQYDRGIILHFSHRDLVIDRGEESWSEIWRATWANTGSMQFGASTPDPEYPDFSMVSAVHVIDSEQRSPRERK